VPHGRFPGQHVPVPAGSGVPAHEAGVLLSAAGERDGHPALGEEDLLTWRSQVESQAGERRSVQAVIQVFLFFPHDSAAVSLQVWEFSHLFSSVDSWHMADVSPISAHLKVCPFYQTSVRSEPVLLPSLGEKQVSGQENLSLINHFTGNKWQH